MLFTSLAFLVFFPSVCLVYFLLPVKLRAYFLLAASYYFYINAQPFYALLLLASTLVTYAGGLWLEKAKSDRQRLLILYLSAGISVGSLVFFKYYHFINQTAFDALSRIGIRWPLPDLKILLPVGISYYTFQSLGYLFDVYRENIKAERNVAHYMLFISFFPVIVSGPIERAGNMLPQFKKSPPFSYTNAVEGLKLILWGYFTKLVIADNLSGYVDEIYATYHYQSGLTLLLATMLFAFQLYCDFSGYSNIAIGTAKMLGFDVMQNFRRPYLFAVSITDFWRRHHISLTKWLTDYIYTPLSIKYRAWGNTGLAAAIMFTFIISGFWHGAAWTFVIYGFLHGIFLSSEALNLRKRNKFEKKYGLKTRWWYVGITGIVTYLMVCFCFIFFRSTSVEGAFDIIGHIFSFKGPLYLGSSTARLFFALVTLAMVLLSDYRDEFYPTRFLIFGSKNRPVRWAGYISIILLILLLGNFTSNQFIYFQF